LSVTGSEVKSFFMKLLAIALLFAGLSSGGIAQSNNGSGTRIPGPQFLNHLYYLQGDSLIPLEQVESRMKSGSRAMGYGRTNAGYAIDGEKSGFRIPSAGNIRFVVKIGMPIGDPSMMIRLYKLDVKKGIREAIINNQGGTGLRYDVQKSGNDVYLIVPAAILNPGEYGFINMMLIRQAGMTMSYTVFAFGID
jgi:hypothetical protein